MSLITIHTTHVYTCIHMHTQERSRQLVIRRENQDIYNRIEKLEKEEGYFSKDRKAHVKRLEHKLKYLKKLKDHGRMVNVLKTQKENEHFLKRIERAVPQYSIKKCKEWYKHHEMFKEGRKTDPTGGHIMHTVDKKLLPRITRHESFDKGSMVSSFESLTHGKSLISESSKRRSKSGGAAGGASSSLLSLTTNPTVMVQPRYALSNMYGSGPGDAMRSRYENDGGEGKEVEEEESLEDEGDDQGYSYEQESYDEVPLKEQEETKSSRKKKDHKATVRSTEEMQVKSILPYHLPYVFGTERRLTIILSRYIEYILIYSYIFLFLFFSSVSNHRFLHHLST